MNERMGRMRKTRGGKYAKINLFINVVMRVGNIYANIKIQIYPTL